MKKTALAHLAFVGLTAISIVACSPRTSEPTNPHAPVQASTPETESFEAERERNMELVANAPVTPEPPSADPAPHRLIVQRPRDYKPFAIVSTRMRKQFSDVELAAVMCDDSLRHMDAFMALIKEYDLLDTSAMDGSMSALRFGGVQDGEPVQVTLFVAQPERMLRHVYVNGDEALACAFPDADWSKSQYVPFEVPSPQASADGVPSEAPAALASSSDGALIRTPATPGPVLYPTSFDCAKAKSVPDHLICSDEDLARMDRELGDAVRVATQRSVDPNSLKHETIAAWKQRERECKDKECLVTWYQQRLEIVRQTPVDSASGDQVRQNAEQ